MLLFIDIIYNYGESSFIELKDIIGWVVGFLGIGATAGLAFYLDRRKEENKQIAENLARTTFINSERNEIVSKLKTWKEEFEAYHQKCKDNKRVEPLPLPNLKGKLKRLCSKIEIDKYIIAYIDSPNGLKDFNKFIDNCDFLSFTIQNIHSIADRAIQYQYERDKSYVNMLTPNLHKIQLNSNRNSPILNLDLPEIADTPARSRELIEMANQRIRDIWETFSRKPEVLNDDPIGNTQKYINENLIFLIVDYFEKQNSSVGFYKYSGFLYDIIQLNKIHLSQIYNVEKYIEDISFNLKKVIEDLEALKL